MAENSMWEEMSVTKNQIEEWIKPSMKTASEFLKVLSFFSLKDSIRVDDIMNLLGLEPQYKLLILFRPEVLTPYGYELTNNYCQTSKMSPESKLGYIKSFLVAN